MMAPAHNPIGVVPVKPMMNFNDHLLRNLPSDLSHRPIIAKPAPALPVETITNILAYVDNTPTLAACALASRTFHDAAIPLLYHTVTLWNDEYLLFFRGILESTAYSQEASTRKMAYLCHLKRLILYRPPTKPLVFSPSLNSVILFPSLHFIEFAHDEESGYVSLFSRFYNIRHVCIANFESGILYSADMGSVFSKWNDVEMLTFYNWYTADNGTHGQPVQDFAIPLAWTKLRQITIYPELASHGVILCPSSLPNRHSIPVHSIPVHPKP